MRFGSFLPGADLFDAAAFATSDAEALVLDPQQRLLLEAVGELLLAGAGGRPASGRRDVGVFVGLSTVDYLKARGRVVCAWLGTRSGGVASRVLRLQLANAPVHTRICILLGPVSLAAHGQAHPHHCQRVQRHRHSAQRGQRAHQLRLWPVWPRHDCRHW